MFLLLSNQICLLKKIESMDSTISVFDFNKTMGMSERPGATPWLILLNFIRCYVELPDCFLDPNAVEKMNINFKLTGDLLA